MDKQGQGGFARAIAMDLGTTSVLVAVRGRGILLQEPSVVAVDRHTGKILQVGQAARQMLGRTPGDLVAVRPLREGDLGLHRGRGHGPGLSPQGRPRGGC